MSISTSCRHRAIRITCFGCSRIFERFHESMAARFASSSCEIGLGFRSQRRRFENMGSPTLLQRSSQLVTAPGEMRLPEIHTK